MTGLAGTVAAGCTTPAPQPTAARLPQTWPDAEWERITPEQAGWDAGALAAAQDYSREIGTASFAVVQHGRMVASWGDISRRLELHSVRKSLLSALIGIATAEGRINLDSTLASLGIDDASPSLTLAEKQATVRQLLQARSGVYHEALYETPGEVSKRPPRGSHEPGTFWYYNNWDFNVLGTIFERATGTTIFDAFAARIATPLSMQDYRVADGRYVRGEATSMHPAYPFHMSARDLARFGVVRPRRDVAQPGGRASGVGAGQHDGILDHAHRLGLRLSVVDRLSGSSGSDHGHAAEWVLGGRRARTVHLDRPVKRPGGGAPDGWQRRHQPADGAYHVAGPDGRPRGGPRARSWQRSRAGPNRAAAANLRAT